MDEHQEEVRVEQCCASCKWWGWSIFTGSNACFNPDSNFYRDNTYERRVCPEWEE